MTLSPPVPPPLSTFLGGGGGGGGVPAAAKRRRLLLSSASVTTAAVAQWTVHHQVSTLHFGYNNDSNNHEDGRLISEERGGWCCYGTTVLYVSNDQETATDTDDQQQQLAFHLRGCCTVESVTVESVGGTAGDDNSSNTTTNNQQLTVLPSLFYHVDPLQHVLLRPVTNPTATDSSVKDHDAADTKDDGDSTKYEYDADAQSSRGAAGMTTGLRAASMASNLGELRVWVETKGKKQQQPPKTTTTTATATTGAIDTTTTAYVTWKRDLERVSQFIPEYAAGGGGGSGAVAQRLSAVLQERSVDRRTKRLHLVASRLAAAAVPPDGKVNNLETTKVVTNRAFKVTIQYSISALNDPLPSTITNDDGTSTLAQQQPHNLAGLQAVSGGTPYVYTVTGVYGDHEGPRCWIPVLDSAAVPHRASHCLTIAVTAPVTAGLSVVGCGEDYGISETVWHDETSNQDAVQRELGSDHFGKIMARQQQQQLFISSPQSVTPRAMHVIPLEHQQQRQASLHTIQATNVWCSQAWLPIPCRSLGFAIGPFKVLEDPEYFGPSALDEKDDDDEEDGKEPFYDRLAAFLESVRKNGKGIRQVYLAPLFERKYIHTRPSTCNVNMSLLPDTRLQLLPLPAPQLAMAEQLDATVTFATTGVPHRALSLMRDVLAAPTYRTYSYTQIWIPNAVHGGCTSGALHHCPEVLVNPFLGGAIMDSRLLPPVGYRLPFFQGGRVLQFLQARCAIRGWITAALPMGGHDDVGTGYLLSLVESFIMSLYERGHGGQGEGGAKGGCFYSKRFSANSGLNSANLDFLPVQNIEESDVIVGVGAVPVEERHNEQLWRGASNGSESHTSAMDEFKARDLLCRDGVEAIERGTDKDKGVPSPSMGWFGSYLSLTFLSSNATSSSDLGCGAVDMLHPLGGLVYRCLKSDTFRGVVEGRAGVANFMRLVRAAVIASYLGDIGERELKLPKRKKKADVTIQANDVTEVAEQQDDVSQPSQPFVVCVNEILKKKGLTHTLFTRALQNLSGRTKEPQLLGTLVDVERHAEDPRTRRPFVDPEGFPNSYVRGASLLYSRVGVHVEATRDTSSQTQSVAKGIQMQAYAEPVITEGGIAYGGPITMRVVENEGSFREYVKDLAADGSRRDWGAIFLHAKPVTTTKAQTAASGAIENSNTSKDAAKLQNSKVSSLDAPAINNAFTDTDFHTGGYQAIELIRLTNLTPLLWVRVDPLGLYGGRISVSQPDPCLAEQLFHDGDASAQIDAIRALAERPLGIQGNGKVTTVYDVHVSELPVRVIGDCLRGSPALHSSLPHTPTVRAQAALAIAQWQNNKAPQSKDAVGADNWVGMNILVQYFRERFYSNAVVMPNKFSRLVLKKSDEEVHQAAAAAEGGVATSQPSYDDTYQYLDTLDDDAMKEALECADAVEMEEDEEYRVRSAVVTAVACLRAKDGLTPPVAIQFLETILESDDAEMVGNLVYDDEQQVIEDTFKRMKARIGEEIFESGALNADQNKTQPRLNYVSSMLVADALLAICHVNSMPAIFTDPATGKTVQSKTVHPLSRLMKAARSWLEWELYRENIRLELAHATQSGVSGNCQDGIAASAVIALSNVAILIQSTTDAPSNERSASELANPNGFLDDVASAKFYINIFDSKPHRNDLTRAASAQALACICCAADRFERGTAVPVGLLTALKFLLDRIIDGQTSVSLRHTLALIMMDACTGKVCSMQRVGAIAGRNDVVSSLARFFCGPLGACHGGDNGSAILMAQSAASFPAASAVNDGARRGMRLLSRAGHPTSQVRQEEVVNVAIFATKLWRTINGEPAEAPRQVRQGVRLMGVCSYDGILRCSLLALWQWIWPKGCYALLQVQSWGAHEGTQHYRDMGGHHVMKISDKEKAAATAEENSLSEINRLVEGERDRQVWRGEMAQKAYAMYKANKGSIPGQDLAAAEKGIGQPLPPIVRDASFKLGGWIASAAKQRRDLALDGGTAVTKVRLKVKSADA